MQIKDWITGLIRLRTVSADPQSFLNYISLNGIIIKNVRWLDDLTVEITVPQSALKKIKEITLIHNTTNPQMITKLFIITTPS